MPHPHLPRRDMPMESLNDDGVFAWSAWHLGVPLALLVAFGLAAAVSKPTPPAPPSR